MSFVARLESKLGRFAIPGLIRIIAIFQLLNWFLIHASPGYASILIFDRESILNGEVWRLFSYLLIPGSFGIVWLLFGVFFLWMLSDGLEAEWGAFRVNLYLVAGVIFSAIGGFLGPAPATGLVLWASVLFAYAYYNPDHEILLYLIVPVKMKWVAWLSAGGLIFHVLGHPSTLISVLFGLLNFFLVFVPGFVKGAGQRVQTANRRKRFDSAKLPDDEPLHRCHVCGKTSIDNPKLGFRVTASGDDICDDCRAQKSAQA